MGRAVRKTYPQKLNYIIRLRAGKIQSLTGIPASTIHRLRKGQVKPSPQTIKKLSHLYDDYWFTHANKRGARPDEITSWLQANRTPEYIIQKELDLYRVALKLQEARNIRDKDHPKFNSKWHTITGIFDQMSRDISRNTDQWLHYVKKNMLISYGKVRYTPLRLEQQKEANKRYHRRKAIIERRKKSKELRATYSLKQIEKWKKDSERLRKKRK